MTFSKAERQYLKFLDKYGEKYVRELYSAIYRHVLKTRIKAKVKQMKEDLELYQRVIERFPDLGVEPQRSKIAELKEE